MKKTKVTAQYYLNGRQLLLTAEVEGELKGESIDSLYHDFRVDARFLADSEECSLEFHEQNISTWEENNLR